MIRTLARRGRLATRGLVVATGAVLALTACGGGEGDEAVLSRTGPATSVTGGNETGGSGAEGDGGTAEDAGDSSGDSADGAGRDLPRLVELSASTGNTYSTVTLRFEPGQGQPTASIEESNDSTLRRPGSGKPVQLAGDQALRVTVSPAVAGDVQPLDPNGPVLAEVRVLGFFEGQTVLGIGVYGEGNLSTQVSRDDGQNTLTIALRNPDAADGPKRQCGEVAFQPASDAGAFNIVAQGVSCEIARDVAARAEGNAGESYTTDSGFTCLPELEQREPIPNIVYTCTRAGAKITFDV